MIIIKEKEDYNMIINQKILELLNKEVKEYEPVNKQSLKYISNFISRINIELPLPNICIESDGFVGLEWNKNKNSIILTHADEGEIIYSVLINDYQVSNKFFTESELNLLFILINIVFKE